MTQQDGADGAFLPGRHAHLRGRGGAYAPHPPLQAGTHRPARVPPGDARLDGGAAFCVVPIMIELPQYSLVQIYFETMSCLTTTGATVMTGLDDLPLSINGWRCFLAWMGGMGLIVLSVAILPLLGVGGAQILKAETRRTAQGNAPSRPASPTPRRPSTSSTWDLRDPRRALPLRRDELGRRRHAHDDDGEPLGDLRARRELLGTSQNPAIETISIIFMVICGFNFSLHFAAWHHRASARTCGTPEAKAWVGALAVLTLISAATLVVNGVYDPLTALRHAAFSVVSAASTSGFGTEDWSAWPSALPILIMLSAGCFSARRSTGAASR